jgi:hypothetical protein
MSLGKAVVLPLVLALSVAATIATTAQARSPKRSRINITGNYSSNWDEVSLVQDGDRVSGQYVCCGGGTIEGRVIEDRIIRYSWSEPRGAGTGKGVWRIAKDGRLDGTWGHGESVDDGGPWTLVPKRASHQIAH